MRACFQPEVYSQALVSVNRRREAPFGLLRQTVERTVGLGTNRQIQFALRLNF